MKILITGSEGFIGSHIVEKLKIKHILTTTDIRPANRKNHYQYDLILDRSRLDYLVRNNDLVIHCASHLGVDNVVQNKEISFKSSLADKIIIDLCKLYNKKIIYFSTSEVYGNNDNCKETDPLIINPNNRGNYALCKLYSEKYIESLELNHIILRPFNIFGKNQDPKKGVIPKLIQRALENKPLKIDSTPAGFNLKVPYRAFCHIDDLINIIDLMIDDDIFKRSLNIYNVGNAENYLSIFEVCELIKDLTNSKSEIEYSEKITDIAYRRPNNQKILNKIDYKFDNNFKLRLENIVEEVKMRFNKHYSNANIVNQTDHQNTLDYLIIACHPDDEVIGCSSIILDENSKVGLIHITRSKNQERDLTPLKLGLDYYFNLNYETFNVKCGPGLIDDLTRLISELNPKTVLGHYEYDNHQDHQELAKALNIALRSNRTNVKNYLQYYIEKPIELDSCLFKKMDKCEKIKLLDLYYNYINKEHYLTILKFNEFCGIHTNLKFAEPFKIKYMKD